MSRLSVQSKILSKRVNDIGLEMSRSRRKEWISGSRRTQEINSQGQSEIVRKRKERPGGLPGHTYPTWDPGEGGGAGDHPEGDTLVVRGRGKHIIILT